MAGGTYDIEFVPAYAGATPDGTPIYIYVPKGWDVNGGAGVLGIDPNVDQRRPMPTRRVAVPWRTTRWTGGPSIAAFGYLLANHARPPSMRLTSATIGDATGAEPGGDAFVVLAYNVVEQAYFDCAGDPVHGGYYAPQFSRRNGLNVIVMDTKNWEERPASRSARRPT